MNSNNSNLIATLQDWFAFVDKTEDLHHRAFQLRWHEEGIKKEIYITENFDIPYCDLSNIILERLVHEHIFDEELIAYPFRQNHQELFYLLKNIVFLLFSDFTLLSRRQHLVFGNETINILFLGNIEVYTLPFLLISNYFPKIRIFVALDKNALLIINEHVYFRYGLFFDGEEVSLVDSTDNPVEVYYIYNKTKKADPELHGLKIPLSGDPHFENLVANKILTHKVVHKAGLARPKCIFFVPQAFTTTVPSQLVDELNLFNDNDIYQLNGNMNAIKKIIDTALYQFDVENIVVKPNLTP